MSGWCKVKMSAFGKYLAGEGEAGVQAIASTARSAALLWQAGAD